MDGGGNDCMGGGNGDPAYAAAQALFQTMASDGVEKVLYFFYPDPLNLRHHRTQALSRYAQTENEVAV
jgi:hypothetical protein